MMHTTTLALTDRGADTAAMSEAQTNSPILRSELTDQAGSMVNPEPVTWIRSTDPVPYPDALARMEARVQEIGRRDGNPDSGELAWSLEHPPLYTAGTSAKAADLLSGDRFPVYKTGRGGEYTYHGPGQLVIYVMLDLNRRRPDLRRYVATLEAWIIASLAEFGVTGERREDRVGVWVARPDLAPLHDGTMREDKIAAIGIRVRKWVTFHGISVNVSPNLSHYDGIVPCGVTGHGVTSLSDLGVRASVADVDAVLRSEFAKRFGPTAPASKFSAFE